MSRTLQALMIALVAVAGGLHVPALQLVAWTGMLVGNTGDYGLTEAVTRTFDGEHPCCLCDFISDAEQPGDGQQESNTVDFVSFKLVPIRLVQLQSPSSSRREFRPLVLSYPAREEIPTVPPPRPV